MVRLVRFKGDGRDDVIVEIDTPEEESYQVGAADRIIDATGDLASKLSSACEAVSAALDELGNSVGPETVKVTFGVKLNAKADAIIAKSSVEGNLQVEMEWKRKR